MATNKHATIRYLALDKCFRDHRKKYYIEDLIAQCNEAIYEFSGVREGVHRRQLFNDIAFMESDQGWSIPLDRVKEGRRVYYRYLDPSFSINNQGINESEMEQLSETLTILSRFKGLPNFEWLEEVQIRLVDTFKIKGEMNAVAGFEHNPFLRGLHFFAELFNAINQKSALSIAYQGYRQEKATTTEISPWYLKQYNNRWFLLGYNAAYGRLTNFALDRIKSISVSTTPYVENTDIDFEEYYDDVVGVTVFDDQPVERLIIRIDKETWPYIESKPLHGSQKVLQQQEEFVEIELRVQVNHELVALLFSYLDAVEVIEPKALRERFKKLGSSISIKND